MPFRYLCDPLFLICLVLYGVNRWLLKQLLPNGFFHTSLNDVICIPFWVPIMLWAMRHVGLRTDDAPPRSYEILIPLLLWSYVFELILPFHSPFQRLAFCDPQDIVCYTGGALFATLFWRGWYSKKRSPCVFQNDLHSHIRRGILADNSIQQPGDGGRLAGKDTP